MSLSSQVITSSWAECSPVTVSTTETIYTTVWTTNLLAANDLSTWEAVYTITEVRTGDPADYVRPAFPPCFVETSVHCGSCAEDKDIIITAPAPTMTEDVTIDGDGVIASALAIPAEDFPVPTDAPEVEDHAGEEFPPTEPLDIDPEIAGGAEVPPGAAPFPEDAELRGEEMAHMTVESALNLAPEATGEAVPDPATADADADADIETISEDSGEELPDLDAADALGLSPEASIEPENHLTVASALNLAPEATDEARIMDDPIEGAEIETDTETGAVEDVAADTLDLPAEVPADVEADPSLTVEDILPLLSGTGSAAPEVTGEAEFRGGAGSDILNEDEALEDELATAFATMTVEVLQSLSTVVVPSASESASFRTSTDETELEDNESSEEDPSTFREDESADSDPASGAAPEEDDGFIVTAAAARTPTQSTTLLAVNALIVGLWVLL